MAKVFSNMAVVAISTILLAIPLYLWRIFYPETDWSVLAIAPLALMLFVGFRKPLSTVLQARSMAALRSDSWVSVLFTGRLKATILSIFFVVVAVPILAWQALGANSVIALTLLALCMAASSMTLGIQRWLQQHLHGPYATWYGISLGASIAAMIFVPILAWIYWAQITYPGEYRSLGFWESLKFGMEQLPPRRGWIAEFLAPLYAIESMQLWLATRFESSAWLPILYSLHLALVAFVVAQASASLVYFVQSNVWTASNIQRPYERTTVQNGAPAQTNRSTASLVFWWTIFFVAGATIGAAILGGLRSSGPNSTIEQVSLDLEPTKVEEILNTASSEALTVVAPAIDALLSDVYAPVYGAIPEYANFHYSVLGEYTELALTVQGRMGSDLQERLFDGFEHRISGALTALDEQYFEAYKSNLDAEIQAAMPAENPVTVLSEATQLAVNDALSRARISYPIAGAAGIVGSGGLKALTAGMATKLGATIAAKAAAKGTLKGGSLLAGTGGGAALCSWGGPLAIACGVGGGIAAWLLADAAIVNLDEFFNRSEFEADLRALIDQDKAEKKELVEEALREKAQQLDEDAEEIAEDFRLKDLSRTNPDN